MAELPDPFDITIGPPRADGLTDEEGHVMDALVVAWNSFHRLESQHPDELAEFTQGIHRLQGILAIRIARRKNPDGWPTHRTY